MPYGTVKVDNITFDNGGADQNVTTSGIYKAITSGVTVSGTISGAVIIGGTSVSGTAVRGTTVTGTTVQGVSGTFTTLTGVTTTGTTANFASGVFTTRISGLTVTGTTAQFTSGTFVSLTGTTVTGTTINAETVNSTTGTFTSLTGTTITGVTVQGTTVVATTGNFTSLTGITTTGTTANFTSGVFTTQVSGLTVTGTQSSFTSGNFVTLSGNAVQGSTGTFTSGVFASGLSATNPSISFVDDPNTGIYSPGADTLAFVKGGVEAMRLDSSGRLLVGTSTARVFDSSTSTLTPLTQVESTGAESAFSIIRNSAVSTGPGLFFGKSRSATLGGTTVVIDGDRLGTIFFEGTDGAKLIEAASITAEVDGAPGLDAMPGRLVFSTTADGLSSPTERMQIDSIGNVGIGTTSPSHRLEVARLGADLAITGVDVNTAILATAGGSSTNSGVAITLAGGTTSPCSIYFGDTADGAIGGLIYDNSTDNLLLRVNGAERMRIRSDGNIAIGGSGGSSVTLYNQGTITGSTTAYANFTLATIQSDVTTTAYVNRTSITTAAAAFTTGNIIHYSAGISTLGAGSAVTDNIGFFAEGNLGSTSAAQVDNAYGFYGSIASAAGRWNFYAAGGAPNFFAGDVRTAGASTKFAASTDSATSVTLTAASIIDGIRSGTPTASINYTLPTGANLDAAFQDLQNNQSFEWSVINRASVTFNITVVANTNHTVFGNMVVSPATSGRFLTRKSTTNTFVTYRIG